jgi:hypothetical protein
VMFPYYNVESLDYLANRNIGWRGEPNRTWLSLSLLPQSSVRRGELEVERPGVDQSEGQYFITLCS